MSDAPRTSTRAVAAALLVAAALSGCLVRYITGPQLTGTCKGACDHYVGCRAEPDRDGSVRRGCVAECPGVFTDRDSLMAFESLACPDAVEFVEGPAGHPPGGHPPPATSSSE